ncbi:PhnD/SsuA/transferrin family substrate-binding protein [Rhizobiales bacterium]|uniref:phosphate/phosphite/phosphonate ABC transporter substrate-binding protein n=1 Tax=Hongsoonwoonella zoysiae TaxID=2821844 RepID=UPI00155F5D8C|nr:PhnD/SsuA/transferrin family substrate-binding protein [Hongsoonwoonella zoysiae]NRG17674.1 PhnD/SsuA/transferrin family substrate-binding protein [Hongsoonwoonella zoysiae]
MPANTTLAVLPMYDWPEVRAETDRLWQALAHELRDADFDSPSGLCREIDAQAAWADPHLLIGQTCGLPFVSRLKGRVSLVGAPAYALEDCGPGEYCSALVVRADDPAGGLGGLRGRRVAYNMEGSQSGHAAMLAAVAPFARGGRFFAEALATGSHRASVRAVAQGKADIAAVDAVSWELAKRHEPSASRLRVLLRTYPTPGLPFITALRPADELRRIAEAVAEGIGGLDRGTKEALLLTGFVPFSEADYDVISARLAEAQRLGYAELC